jgi:hypothetical protein
LWKARKFLLPAKTRSASVDKFSPPQTHKKSTTNSKQEEAMSLNGKRKSSDVHSYSTSNKKTKTSNDNRYISDDDGGGSLSQFSDHNGVMSSPQRTTNGGDVHYQSSFEFEDEKGASQSSITSPEPFESQPTVQSPPRSILKNNKQSNEKSQRTPNGNNNGNNEHKRLRIKESELRAEKLTEAEKDAVVKSQISDEASRQLYKQFNELRPIANEYVDIQCHTIMSLTL